MSTTLHNILTGIFDFILLVKAEFQRDLIYMRRYPLEILSFIFFMYLILMAILFGFSQLMSDQASKVLNQETMILGYCLMQFVLAAQMGWSGQIQNESQTGTLEQLSISGHTLGGVLLSRGIAQFPRNSITFFIYLVAYRLSIPEARIDLAAFGLAIPVLFLTAFGVFGIAYLFAGITLLFKRVGFFFQIINFGFLGLFWQNRAAMTEGGTLALLYDFFPLTAGLTQLKNILIRIPQTGEQSGGIRILVLTSLASVAIGYFLFFRMEMRARKMALLSQY